MRPGRVERVDGVRGQSCAAAAAGAPGGQRVPGGRMAYYRLDDAHVRMLLDLGLTHTEHTAALHTAALHSSDTGQRP
jgi:hypothetical protein